MFNIFKRLNKLEGRVLFLELENESLSEDIALLKDSRDNKETKITPNTSVRELLATNRAELYTSRAITLLTREGIQLVSQLTNKTEYDLLAIDRLGINTVGYIQDTLARHGLRLRTNPRVIPLQTSAL